MRQAGRYLPEYLATRSDAGSFLDLCYDSNRAAEVTLQPIRRFGFDAAILFADILLIPHALGRRLWFETGEGPRLEPLSTLAEVQRLAVDDHMHDHMQPVYETVRLVRSQLPDTTALIGFAGAPWTVATYVIAGRGKDGQQGALTLMREQPVVFSRLMARLEEATVAYLDRQIRAGADVVKLFDSWAGALTFDPELFSRWCVEPLARITRALRQRHPSVPVIAFPRGAGPLYRMAVQRIGAQGIAIDESLDPVWARDELQPHATVQGNLDARHLVEGGPALDEAARRIVEVLGSGPFVFNLGHGITPDADPRNVERLLRIVRG